MEMQSSSWRRQAAGDFQVTGSLTVSNGPAAPPAELAAPAARAVSVTVVRPVTSVAAVIPAARHQVLSTAVVVPGCPLVAE